MPVCTQERAIRHSSRDWGATTGEHTGARASSLGTVWTSSLVLVPFRKTAPFCPCCAGGGKEIKFLYFSIASTVTRHNFGLS